MRNRKAYIVSADVFAMSMICMIISKEFTFDNNLEGLANAVEGKLGIRHKDKDTTEVIAKFFELMKLLENL